jgi:glyoxylase-like metal-dependent hydrolase (beta-lactamase superfamily II)
MIKKPYRLLAIALTSITTNSLLAQDLTYSADLLTQIRDASHAIPGALPTSINFVKFAESHRTYSVVIEDGGEEPFISARTAFQIIYQDGSVMIDAGMDETVHQFYGFGRVEPYWPERNQMVQDALRQANMVLITHEHGDHIAGVIRSDIRDEIASKTILTKAQVNTLIDSPQLPEIGLTEDLAAKYIVIDYDKFLPIAPGIVLIRAAGHTPGHQIIYAQLETGMEYVFIGDIGWSLDNVIEIKPRPQSTINRIGEDPQALVTQLTWLNGLLKENLLVIPSHDDSLLFKYAAEGLLNDSFIIH